ncbi:MAG: DUF4405 domain-containing protein [Dehalococcoidia bacterium]|nr:DUF4405 domain-containing protein [Dehalococcoidia bacterium]
MRKNVIRIILDAAMAVLLILMYKKTAVSMEFHEIGGLVVIGMFLFHNLLNRKWIVGISKRLFGRKLATRFRVSYVVDVLLLICMVFIAMSGIMISKTILLGISGNVAVGRLAHYFFSAFALVLVGVHIGLHWSFIRTTFAKMLRLPRAVARPLGIALLALVLIYGGVSMVTSNFTNWLTDPLTVLAASADGLLEIEGEHGGGQGKGVGDGTGSGNGAGETSPAQVLGVITTYGSIAAVFAALTVLVETTLKKKRPRLVAQPA